jgi:hypothetical protein
MRDRGVEETGITRKERLVQNAAFDPRRESYRPAKDVDTFLPRMFRQSRRSGPSGQTNNERLHPVSWKAGGEWNLGRMASAAATGATLAARHTERPLNLSAPHDERERSLDAWIGQEMFSRFLEYSADPQEQIDRQRFGGALH